MEKSRGKMVKKEVFALLLEKVDAIDLTELEYNEVVRVLKNEIALIEKKTSDKRVSGNAEANANFKDIILEVLEEQENAVTVSEMIELDDRFVDDKGKKLSNQRMSALFTQLKNEGLIIRLRDKKKAVFKLKSKATDKEIEEFEKAEEESKK